MEWSSRVLLVEDDDAIRFAMARHLERFGFQVAEAPDCATARERFSAFQPLAVVTDFRLPDGDALELIEAFRREKPRLPILVMTGFGTIELAVRAVKSGAENLLTKPVDLQRLTEELRRAVGPNPSDRSGVRNAVPRDRGTLGLQEEIDRLKDVECSLLIQGETGTGKTRFVRALHDASRRRERPFIDLNCAGLTRELVESELFGHERGAFTSAHAAKPGMFELASGGTLFLDEIGDIDPAVQPKVLKAIEEKRFRRIGAAREQVCDVRIVAATHRDLREAVRTGAFRADLYYRLSTVTITLRPLREHRDEIPALARELLGTLARGLGRPAPSLARDAELALARHSWPGNVRELRNVLERALHLASDRDELAADDLRLDMDASASLAAAGDAAGSLQEVERAHIERALAAHGHVGEAARSLGISRSTLYMKLKAYGISTGRASTPRLKVGGVEDP